MEVTGSNGSESPAPVRVPRAGKPPLPLPSPRRRRLSRPRPGPPRPARPLQPPSQPNPPPHSSPPSPAQPSPRITKKTSKAGTPTAAAIATLVAYATLPRRANARPRPINRRSCLSSGPCSRPVARQAATTQTGLSSIGAGRLLHVGRPSFPGRAVPRLRRQEIQGLRAQSRIGNERLQRPFHHPPPIFRVSKHGEIAAHGLPEILTPLDPHGLEPPGSG